MIIEGTILAALTKEECIERGLDTGRYAGKYALSPNGDNEYIKLEGISVGDKKIYLTNTEKGERE